MAGVFYMGKARETLGDYLSQAEPLGALWTDMVGIVFEDDPRRARPERLGPSARTLYEICWFQGEVINGGFSQFFSNTSGDRAHDSLAALRRIGAPLCVALLEKALTLFPGGIAPVDQQQRCELVFAFEEREPQLLDELNRQFYERVDALGSFPEEDLTALQLAFMRSHRDERVCADPPS
jgi:Domain of unknown function (DUF4375)